MIQVFIPMTSMADISDSATISGKDIPHLQELQEIIDYGIVNIGNLDLIKIVEEAKKLTVHIHSGAPVTIQNQERRSAKYSIPEKEVFINKDIIAVQRENPNNDRNIDATLYFHEYLGALGYDDRHYQISSTLSLTYLQVQLAPLHSHYADKLNVWKKYLKRLAFNRLPIAVPLNKVGGGSTTTEGGGDYSAALYKHLMLYHEMFEIDEVYKFTEDKLDIVRFILNLKIEVDWNTLWTRDRVISMRKDGPLWVLWLPANFSIESIIHKLDPSHPNSVLKYVIQPIIQSTSQASNRIECRKLLSAFENR